MKSKACGILLILCGLASILSAAALVGYNLWDGNRADDSAQEALAALAISLPEAKKEEITNGLVSTIPFTIPQEAEDIPPYILNPELEMPEKMINGIAYIGVLDIPDLNLELPIASEWNSTTAKTAPCRYYGSVYLNNMVVAGHNYQKHFGKLSSLPMGSLIRFTDMEGNEFLYETISLETIQATDIEGMCQGEWDLTLFSCTVGGHARSAVRCKKL